MFKKLAARIPFLLLLFILFTSLNQAQINYDSLKIIWEDPNQEDSIRFKAIGKYYISNTYSHPDTVIELTNYHYELGKSRDSIREMANASNAKAHAYYLKGNINNSLNSLTQSISLYKQLDDPISLATVYSNLGNIYGEQNKFKEAVGYFKETLEIFRKEKDKQNEARILNNLGLIHYNIDSYEIALDHFNQALGIYNSIGFTDKKGRLFFDIACVYYKQGKYFEAIEKGEEALKILQDINNQFIVADCYFLLAESFRQISEIDKAKSYLAKSLEIGQTINNNSKIIERLTFEADLLFDEDIGLATLKGEETLNLLKPNTKHLQKANLYKLLYKCYKSQGKLDLSLSMYEKFTSYSDSLQIEKTNNSIVREAIQTEFETKLSQSQLENELAQEKLKFKHFKRIMTIGLFCIFLVITSFFYSRLKIKASDKKRDELLVEIERLKNIDSSILPEPNIFQLNRDKIEHFIDRKLNETDWSVLNTLLNDPVISNKDIADKIFMSVDGIGSSLRRMYEYFDIKESKYKKISLLMKAIKLSND